MRRILIPLLAFVAPFVLFALYRWLLGRRTMPQAQVLTALFITGAVLAAQAFALSALTEPHLRSRAPEPPAIAPVIKEQP